MKRLNFLFVFSFKLLRFDIKYIQTPVLWVCIFGSFLLCQKCLLTTWHLLFLLSSVENHHFPKHLIFLALNFEITAVWHAVGGCNPETPCVLSTQVPPVGTSCQIIAQHHSRGIDMVRSGCGASPSLQGPSQPPPALPPLLPPSPLAGTHVFSISTKSTCQECDVSGIIQHVTFQDWLFSLVIILWRVTQVACITRWFLFIAY